MVNLEPVEVKRCAVLGDKASAAGGTAVGVHRNT